MVPFLIVKNEFLRNLKNKKNLIIIFLLPLLAIILSIGVNSLMKKNINIGVLGDSNEISSFIERVENVDRINVNKASADAINTDMILGKYIAVVEFSDGKQNIYCLNNEIKPLIQALVNEVVNSNSTNILQKAINMIDNNSLTVAERSCGFMFIMLMISTIISTITIVSDIDKGILIRYNLSPNKSSQYLIGKYLYSLIMTIMQITTTILIISLLKVKLEIPISSFLVAALITGIITTSVSMLIAVLSKSELQGNLIASCFGVITIIIGGTFMSIEKMPKGLKFISNISISKWIAELVRTVDGNIITREKSSIIIFLTIFSILIVILSLKIGEKKLAKN